jgi:5-methylthioribose kinase
MNKPPPGDAATVMKALGWLHPSDEVADVSIAGAGNMNKVERVTLADGRSLILKRANPWVEKYPQIPAPVERSLVEARFYNHVDGTKAGAQMPTHLGHDQGHAANLLTDLGEGRDGMALYGGATLSLSTLEALADWMSALHGLPAPDEPLLRNRAMRRLNAEHIFDFPFAPGNGFDVDAITPGLQKIADAVKADQPLQAAIQEVKTLYLGSEPGVLLHGDLYPGSWLETDQGLYVIDPEFCWIGPPEWDVGVLIAHFMLSRQPAGLIEQLLMRYATPLNRPLLNSIIGVEILRRLLGVAQLPLPYGLSDKASLIGQARELIMKGSPS